MKIVLSPGEKIAVEFAESDGSIVVEFNETDISVVTAWPDTTGRVGTIYQEKFSTTEGDEKA